MQGYAGVCTEVVVQNRLPGAQKGAWGAYAHIKNSKHSHSLT